MFTYPVGFFSSAVAELVFGAPDFTSSVISPLSFGSVFSAAHGLGVTPDLVVVEHVCLVANAGYAVGDVITWRGCQRDATGGIDESGGQSGANDTDCFHTIAPNRYPISLKTGGGNGFAVNNWGIRFKAWTSVSKFKSSGFGEPTNTTKFSAAHGLGSGTYFVMMVNECLIANNGFSVGDEVQYSGIALINSGGTATSRGYQMGYNATDVFALITSLNVINKTTGQNGGGYTNGDWDVKLVVFELPAADFTSSPLPWSDAGANTAIHGLAPVNFMLAEMVCNTAERNWSIGDRMPYNHILWDTASGGSGENRGSTIGYDDVNLFSAHAAFPYILIDQTTALTTDGFTMTPANWDIVFSGWGDLGNLGSVLPDNLCDIDATFSDSYDGSSQTFSNRNPAPSDASPSSDWDFHLGVDGTVETKDPAFFGTPGTPGAGFLMSFTNQAGFQMKNLPAFLTKLHRTTGGQEFTIAIAGKFLQGGGGSQTIFGNNAVGSSQHGLRIEIQGTGGLRIRQSNGASLANSTIAGANTVPVSATDQLIVIKCSFDTSIGTDNGYAVNADTFTSFTVTSNAASTDATNVWSAGANGPGLSSTWMDDAAIIRAVSIFDGFMSDSELATLRSIYNGRHGSLYV